MNVHQLASIISIISALHYTVLYRIKAAVYWPFILTVFVAFQILLIESYDRHDHLLSVADHVIYRMFRLRCYEIIFSEDGYRKITTIVATFGVTSVIQVVEKYCCSYFMTHIKYLTLHETPCKLVLWGMLAQNLMNQSHGAHHVL